MSAVTIWRGLDWSTRWRNELSPDQRCWTPDKVQQGRRLISSSRQVRSAPPCPCPPQPCPTLMIGGWQSSMELSRRAVPPRRTLDDLPMQHTQEDALIMLGRRRAQTAAQLRILRQEGGEIKKVSNFGRRMFECAVNNRGKCPLPIPSASEAAVLFFRAPHPSWSPQAADRLKPRAQSVTTEQAPAIGSLTSTRQRPGSEPPIKWEDVREFNHVRYHRQVYPHINRLVERYNEDMKVVCPQRPELYQKRRNSRDFSVASEFYLVPLRQEEEAEIKPEEVVDADMESPKQFEEEEDNASVPSYESGHLQQLSKMEDQLSKASTKGSAGVQEPAPIEKAASEVEPSPPWRCWVDDATVSTVYSRAPSPAEPEDVAVEEEPPTRHMTLGTVRQPDTTTTTSPAANKRDSQHQPAEVTEKSPTPPQPAPPTQKDKKGRKKKEEPLPEPPPHPPPVEEPEIVVEEVVEEVEPEPEPEPVLPSYICPSSADKSHSAEIRRWIHKSPFKAATKTMPIF